MAAEKKVPVLKAREITSAMTLSSPAMCTGMMEEALARWRRKPMYRSRCPAMTERELRNL